MSPDPIRDRLLAALVELLAVEEQREDISRRKQRRENRLLAHPERARAIKAEHEAWKVRRYRAFNESRAAAAFAARAAEPEEPRGAQSMTTDTEALPPLPDVTHLVPPEHRRKPHIITAIHEEMRAYARAALAQRQQVPDAQIEAAFREGYFSRETYNDKDTTDVDEQWQKARAALTAAPQAAQPGYSEVRGGQMAQGQPQGTTPGVTPGTEADRPTTSPQAPAQAQPQEPPRSAPLTEEQAIAIAAYYDVTSAMVRDIYNRAHGISTPEEPKR